MQPSDNTRSVVRTLACAHTAAQGTSRKNLFRDLARQHGDCPPGVMRDAAQYSPKAAHPTMTRMFRKNLVVLFLSLSVSGCGYSIIEAVGRQPKSFVELMNFNRSGFTYKIVIYKYYSNSFNVHWLGFQSYYSLDYIYTNTINGRVIDRDLKLAFSEDDFKFYSEVTDSARGSITFTGDTVAVDFHHPSFYWKARDVYKPFEKNGFIV